MAGKINDLRGREFDRLRVLKNAVPEIRNHHAYWPCVCSCKDKIKLWVRGTHLVRGKVVSCGCWRADPAVRSGARLKTPKARRKAIAAAGRLGQAGLGIGPYGRRSGE